MPRVPKCSEILRSPGWAGARCRLRVGGRVVEVTAARINDHVDVHVYAGYRHPCYPRGFRLRLGARLPARGLYDSLHRWLATVFSNLDLVLDELCQRGYHYSAGKLIGPSAVIRIHGDCIEVDTGVAKQCIPLSDPGAALERLP